MLCSIESKEAQPPALLAALARTLKISADELLCLEPVKDTTAPRTARLFKRLRKVEELAPADQRTVLKLLDALQDARVYNSSRSRRRVS